MLPGTKNLSRLLQLAHKYGPCSPLKGRKSKIPSLHQILIDDQTRVNSIHSKISNQQYSPVADSIVKLPANDGGFLGTTNFLVKIGLGKPGQNFTVEFDTGSSLTWIQCQPCGANQCYTQQDPYFNSSASSTYSNTPCSSNACSQLNSAGYAQSSCITNCIYHVYYGDGSSSQRYFATDTLTLSSSDVFPNFEFGCGENSQGTFGSYKLNSSTDGLLGFGRGQISMVSQTTQKYGGLFSYCLPSTTNSTGFLAFGSQVGNSSSNAQYTPLLIDSNNSSYYYLNMTGISVRGKKLSISETVFKTSGTIIDSGTVITRLAPTPYLGLRSAFRQAMSKYSAAASPDSLFDTCYNLSGYSKVELPTIVLHFGGGAEWNVDQSGIVFGGNSTPFCLAFAGNRDATQLAILGNTQQQTFEVVYDIVREKLGFGAGACS
ncbi:aspartyl protease family protein At5g10770-like [Macadamia integrifolia]|uniref:aspartyl protease family protein At5g10770-like n=1 Tax=Macadamia integrifolia TaxID=60698 RepID=UPI001C4E3E7B|nr:aspartyl protease family protein At5g10770-like [Macadamia integrifolia]